MKIAAFLFACFLTFIQTPAAAESGRFSKSAATARVDFQIKIPHTMRLRFSPLAISANETPTASAAGAMNRTSLDSVEDTRGTRMYAVSVMSTYGHVIIQEADHGQGITLPPRNRAGLSQYRGVVNQMHSSSPGLIPAVYRAQPGFTPQRTFSVAAP